MTVKPKFGYPYASTEGGNTGIINDNTDGGNLPLIIREGYAQASAALDSAANSFNSLDSNMRFGFENLNGQNIADGSITYVKLNLNGDIVAGDIADGTITHEKLGLNVVHSDNILDGEITHNKLAQDVVHHDNILDGTIRGSNISPNTIAGSNVVDGTITRDKLAPGIISLPDIEYLTGTTNTARTYTIPAGVRAILITAYGAGAGGKNIQGGHGLSSSATGAPGGNTTISNSSIGLNITAAGGNNNFNINPPTSATGQVLKYKGSSAGRNDGNEGDAGRDANGSLVKQYIKSSNLAGKVLAYNLGAGGAKPAGTRLGATEAEDGEDGLIEIQLYY